MLTKLLSIGLFAAAVAGMLAFADSSGVAADAKKKAAPLKTDDLFKKLDANSDKKVDLDEFKKLFTVQPEPKGKKGKEQGPFDLPFVFKSLDANSDKTLSVEEFKGIVPAVFPAPKK